MGYFYYKNFNLIFPERFLTCLWRLTWMETEVCQPQISHWVAGWCLTQVKRISSWRIVFVFSKTCTRCCKGPPYRIFTVDCTYTGFVNACLSKVKSTLIFFISKIQIMMELYLCGSSLVILLFFFLPRFSPSTRFLFKLIIIYSSWYKKSKWN